MSRLIFARRSFGGLTLLVYLGVGIALNVSYAQTTPRDADGTPGRSLGIASVSNLRDLGGYKTKNGATVQKGLAYRSDQLSGIRPDDMKKLGALDLKVAYDLRTTQEREKRPDKLLPGVAYVWLNVLADLPQAGPAQLEPLMKDPKKANAVLGDGKAAEMFKKAYREFVSLPSAKREFRKLFLGLSD